LDISAYNPQIIFYSKTILTHSWSQYQKNICFWLKPQFFMNFQSWKIAIMKLLTSRRMNQKDLGLAHFVTSYTEIIRNTFAHIYLLVSSCCNIILSKKMHIKLWEPIQFLTVYIKYLSKQDLGRLNLRFDQSGSLRRRIRKDEIIITWALVHSGYRILVEIRVIYCVNWSNYLCLNALSDSGGCC